MPFHKFYLIVRLEEIIFDISKDNLRLPLNSILKLHLILNIDDDVIQYGRHACAVRDA